MDNKLKLEYLIDGLILFVTILLGLIYTNWHTTLLMCGLWLLISQKLFWKQMDFFDSFPSHESIGLWLIVTSTITSNLWWYGFIVVGVLLPFFNFEYPQWLREKNSKKISILINRK